MKLEKYTLYILAYNVEPNGISGGETILIETFKRMRKRVHNIRLYTWKPGYDLYTSQGLSNVLYTISPMPVIKNLYLSFLIRILYGIKQGLTLKLNPENVLIYPSSDFWPDAICAILLKLRYPHSKLLANFYLTAPNPFRGFHEKGKITMPNIRGILYWLMQIPVYRYYKYFADFIFVTSEPDIKKFPRQKELGRYFVIKGGVDLQKIRLFQKKYNRSKKTFDGVFMGRFHPQKGVLELLEIWEKVVKQIPNAKLAMIGDGLLMPKIKEKIKELGLESNISLLGYILDPFERYKIFQESKVALHPAIYDSGGMAVAEAMAFGLPAVSFDLEALKTYYPTGMVKVPIGDNKKFSETIVDLLKRKSYYESIKREAAKLIRDYWDWDKRVNDLLLALKEI